MESYVRKDKYEINERVYLTHDSVLLQCCHRCLLSLLRRLNDYSRKMKLYLCSEIMVDCETQKIHKNYLTGHRYLITSNNRTVILSKYFSNIVS